ncbi:MAG: hypothetical protein Q9227_009434 [Pyrenula ochraceoflavens]
MAAICAPSPSNLSPVDRQVWDTILDLSKVSNSKIEPPSTPFATIEQRLRNIVRPSQGQKRPLKLFYVEFSGTYGDVATSMTLLKTLMEKKDLFDISFAVDPRSVQHMSTEMANLFRSDIKRCQSQGFLKCVTSTYQDVRPEVIVRGHPTYRFYGSDYDKLFDWIYKCLKWDDCVLADIKSYYFDPPSSNKWPSDYQITPNRFTLVGQQPEIYGNPDPMKIRQVLVGKYKTQAKDQGTISSSLDNWIKTAVKQKKNIIYLGIGGFMRPYNAPLHGALTPLKNFADSITKQEAKKYWNVILFHNAPRPSGISDPPLTNQGRVYHIWYGEFSLLEVWRQTGVDIVLNHCGAGSFSDAIVADKPMICMPYDQTPVNGVTAGKDGVVFAQKVQDLGLGVQVTPINMAWARGYDISKLDTAFSTVVKNWATYKKNVDKLQGAMEKYSGTDNAIEMIERAALGLRLRKQSDGDDSCPS